MAKRKVYCSTEGCFDERMYLEAGLCAACYQGMRYWSGRTPTQVVRRQQQLDRLQARMEALTPKVRQIRSRRTRRTA